MASKKHIGTHIILVGLGSLLLATCLFVGIVLSIYLVTSYYQESWQFAGARLAGLLASAGVLLVPIGFIVNVAHGAYERKY